MTAHTEAVRRQRLQQARLEGASEVTKRVCGRFCIKAAFKKNLPQCVQKRRVCVIFLQSDDRE